MRRGVLLLVVVLLLAVAHPVESVLRAQGPPAADPHRLGAGRLLGSVLLGPLRPLLLTYCWIRSDVLYGDGRMDESFHLMRFVVQLYPNNERARNFIGWRLAFNFKSEAPADRVEIGWLWAQEGLDALLGTEEGRSWVADWIRKQCGQNSLYLQRYAGPEWEREREWRRRLRAWGRRHFGEDLGRFELGLRVLRGRDHLFDRARRMQLLEALALEELLRTGEAPHAPEAVAALRAVAAEFADAPGDALAPDLERRAALLETLAAGNVPGSVAASDAYRAAAALWGRGAHRRDGELLAAAAALFDGLGAFPEERELVARWRAHLRDPSVPRPPLPFDGAP